MARKKDRIVCGLDVGTTKICAIVASVNEAGCKILSSGYSEARGLQKGVVVDLPEASASIRRATDEAELKAGISVDTVTAGMSGDHIQSFNCHGAASVDGKHNEVSSKDTEAVIKAASSIPIPPEREIIHVIPQQYVLDNRGGIKNPVGLTGSRLDVDVHVVTCEGFMMQNLINAVNASHIRVAKVVLQQLATADAVLSEDEKELGVAVIDIGGGTTDIAQFAQNTVRSTSVLPVGGVHFTRDLAICLRTPVEEAEKIKKSAGGVLTMDIANDESIQVPRIGDSTNRSLPRRMVCQVLRDRAMEVLELVRDQIHRSGDRDQLSSGAVLTGGSSLLNGITILAEEILEMPVRRGVPQGVLGLTEELEQPAYATAVGLTMQAAAEPKALKQKGPVAPWLFGKILSWVDN